MSMEDLVIWETGMIPTFSRIPYNTSHGGQDVLWKRAARTLTWFLNALISTIQRILYISLMKIRMNTHLT